MYCGIDLRNLKFGAKIEREVPDAVVVAVVTVLLCVQFEEGRQEEGCQINNLLKAVAVKDVILSLVTNN